jgi:hypothetical protein
VFSVLGESGDEGNPAQAPRPVTFSASFSTEFAIRISVKSAYFCQIHGARIRIRIANAGPDPGELNKCRAMRIRILPFGGNQWLRSVHIMFVYGGKDKCGNAEFAVFFILISAYATLKTVSCNIISNVITLDFWPR